MDVENKKQIKFLISTSGTTTKNVYLTLDFYYVKYTTFLFTVNDSRKTLSELVSDYVKENGLSKILSNGFNIKTKYVEIKTNKGKTTYTFINSRQYTFSYVDDFIDVNKIMYILNVTQQRNDIILGNINFDASIKTYFDSIKNTIDEINQNVGCIMEYMFDYSQKKGCLAFTINKNEQKTFLLVTNEKIDFIGNSLSESNINYIKNKMQKIVIMLDNTIKIIKQKSITKYEDLFIVKIKEHLNTSAGKATIIDLNEYDENKRKLIIYPSKKNDRAYYIDINSYDDNGNLLHSEFSSKISNQKISSEFANLVAMLY